MVNYLLFKKHVDPNVEGKSQWRPLEYACWNGHPRIVDMLLKDKRTDLNYNHPTRGSCLHLAAKGHHFQICQMLLMHNIDFTLENQNGLKAKDATESRKILDIIAWYESNMASNNNRQGRGEIEPSVAILEEEKEEDEPADSSYTASPNLNSELASRNLSG
jgi:ankyrin repeat protein